MTTAERVVLLEEDGREAGTAAKSEVHAARTPLHLGFSCYVLDGDGRLLVTRRALAKRTWPGVWTNSFCGHPAPGEDPEGAVRRRAQDELGMRLTSVSCALPDFRYRAIDAGGVEENEICPVFVAHPGDGFAPREDEVSEWAWIPSAQLADVVAQAPFAFSPWMVEQLPLLLEAGSLERTGP